MEFCNRDFICNIDWLIKSNLTNFEILDRSNEFNVSQGLNNLNAKDLGVKNLFLDLNTIPLLECLDKQCSFEKLNNWDDNYRDIMVNTTTENSINVIQIISLELFRINLNLNYRLFFTYISIFNVTDEYFTVEIENKSLLDSALKKNYSSKDFFRDESIKEIIKIEYFLFNETFNNQSESNSTEIKNVYDTSITNNQIILTTVTINKSLNTFQTSIENQQSSTFTIKYSDTNNYNQTIFNKLESDKLINILNINKNDLNGCLRQCSNNGNCVYDISKKKYCCKCLPGFVGKACEINLDPCSNLKCLNNGTCISLSNYQFTCMCSIYTFGNRCENLVDICLNNSCSNNGICQSINHRPKCKCFKNFFGDSCQHETQDQILVKNVRKISLIISIIVIFSFFIIIISIDLANLFGNKINKGKNKLKTRQVKIFRSRYLNLTFFA